jgi:uncharacterized membrane protein
MNEWPLTFPFIYTERIIDVEHGEVVRPWIWITTLAAVFCILCVFVALLVHRQVQRKPLPLSNSNLADEENDLLEKSESYQCKFIFKKTF